MNRGFCILFVLLAHGENEMEERRIRYVMLGMLARRDR